MTGFLLYPHMVGSGRERNRKWEGKKEQVLINPVMWAPPSSKPNYLKASSSKLGFRASTYQLEEIHSALNCVCVCLSTFFLALHMLQANCVYFLHSLEAAISPRSPGSLYWRTILETKIWAADVLTAAGVPLLLGLPSRKSKKTCVCTPTLM